MATEHSPRPGGTWAAELVRVERVIPDGAPEPRPNRAARRAAARAARAVRPTDGPSPTR